MASERHSTVTVYIYVDLCINSVLTQSFDCIGEIEGIKMSFGEQSRLCYFITYLHDDIENSRRYVFSLEFQCFSSLLQVPYHMCSGATSTSDDR